MVSIFDQNIRGQGKHERKQSLDEISFYFPRHIHVFARGSQQDDKVYESKAEQALYNS